MNEDRSSGTAQEGRPLNWLEKIGQALQGEPKDREALLEVIKDAHRNNVLDRDAYEMIDGVMNVSETQVRDAMLPRSQITVVERDADLQTIIPIVVESAHSRFPVIGENRDEVVGILLAKDLLPYVGSDERSFDMREVLRPVFFVPESKRLNVLLKEFQTNRNHMAVVVDEYGGVSGLITIEDVIEQITGEIEDEHDFDDEEQHIQASSHPDCYLVQALTPIDEINEHFATQYSDEEFDTIGGLVLNGFGHLPKRGEQLELDSLLINVIRADNRRIHLLEVCPVELAGEKGEGEDE